MKLTKRAAALAMISLLAAAGLNCKNSQKNGNQKGANESRTKPGRWVAQYRSPASLKYTGANLAVFYYSAISVVSPNVVFVCGDTPSPGPVDERVGVILKTTDGGQSWTETAPQFPGMQIPALNSIHFISPETGWAVGADSGQYGIVLKTTDGGSSWSATRLTQKQVPTTVAFVDPDNGWIGGATSTPGQEEGIGGPSSILATTDGGRSWQSQYNIPISIHRLCFVDRTNGWAGGSKGTIYNTTDAGRTWDTQRTEIELGDGPVDLRGEGVKLFAIRGLQFLDKDNGFAAATATETKAGRMLVTSNGGAAWRRQWMVQGGGVRDVFFLTPNEGWALTDDSQYIYHTVDGGRTWLSEPRVFEQDVTLSRLAGADAGHIWAVGGGAIFYRVTE
jgi:photosystem II stability/assembly factor-like uncharacterized protein